MYIYINSAYYAIFLAFVVIKITFCEKFFQEH